MLRPMEWNDVEWVRKERNKPENRQWFRQDHLISRDEQERWFKTTRMKSFLVFEPLQDCGLEPVGVVSLSKIDPVAGKCEFSIMIVPEVRKRGFGTKALMGLLDIAFNDLNMNQVYSDVFDQNPALDTYLKMGFKVYGVLPNWYYKNGKYINSAVISITKDEYNSLKQTFPE